MDDLKILQEKFPFLTIFKYADAEYVGIVQNQSKNVLSVYIYEDLIGIQTKKKFLEMGDVWWWGSNRKIPINLFLKKDFDEFEYCLKNFIAKEVVILQGPVISLQNLSQKRSKRKRIELIRE